MLRWWGLTVLVAIGAFCDAASLTAAEPLQPGEPVAYRPFFPQRWQARQQSTQLVPWEGEQVVLLTTTAELDGPVMAAFLDRLDGGWKLYADLVGRSPAAHRQHNGKVTIAAVPDAGLTCGYGCGYLGAGGIEVAGFYTDDYPLVREQREAFAHYYFYEMGRNYFVFGDRHSAFATGFAVFMRYVCMDALECRDPDRPTRQVIERAEAELKNTELSFQQAFTNAAGMDEKAPRLPNLSPSDQPVMYASAMLKLRREYGGDEWVRRFFRHLNQCPPAAADTEQGARAQSLNWLVAASCAARQDLAGVFADRWRLELDEQSRAALNDVDWLAPDLSAAKILRSLQPADPPPSASTDR